MTAQERYEEQELERDIDRDRELERDRVIEPEAETGARSPESPDESQSTGGTADLIRQPADERTPDEMRSATVGDANDVRASSSAGGTTDLGGAEVTPLLPPEGVERFRGDWERIQVGFVDEPREAVQRADQLVAGLMREIAEGFAKARSALEADWGRGEDVSTEDLRLALQRYRSFFQRLLAA